MVKTHLLKAEPVTFGDGDYRLSVKHTLWIFEWHETYIGSRSDLFGCLDWVNASSGAPVTAYWKILDLDYLLRREIASGKIGGPNVA